MKLKAPGRFLNLSDFVISQRPPEDRAEQSASASELMQGIEGGEGRERPN